MTSPNFVEGRLALESGAVFEGKLFGHIDSDNGVAGEVVFNTCMTGYQEIISDPSYAGQIIVMTYPLIGNYGCRDQDMESARVHCRALIIKELSVDIGHPLGEHTLEEELRRWKVPGLCGVDTRALTRHVRNAGTLRGIVAASDGMSEKQQIELAKSAPSVSELDLVAEVSQSEIWTTWTDPLPPMYEQIAGKVNNNYANLKIAVLDTGAKYNQLRALRSRSVEVVRLGPDSTLEEVLRHAPNGVLMPNGPGDPASLVGPISLCRQLLEKKIPLLGICLGHQILGRAIGATTSRLKFGHHGGNHPVKNLRNGNVYVTSQNHEFQVDAASIDSGSGWMVSEYNLNDNSVEGLCHRELPAFSVQYHPEGAPGPQDRAQVFDDFLELAAGNVGNPIEIFVGEQKPKDKTVESVLVIGSGPIIIGQAAEFDYAGTQACKALREEGIKVILVNSNPATIMTDDDIADVVYIEPLTVDVLGRIIECEKPEGLLGTLGGQTGLNLTVALDDAGILERYGVKVLGTSLEAIKTAEDRELFKEMLSKIGEPYPVSRTVSSLVEARQFREQEGLPLVIRPAFTLGGTGGGFCDTDEQFIERVNAGLAASPINQVLVERSLMGWRELEYEVVRDAAGTCVTVCNMENLDPMGVHTGDSIVVAPVQTLTDRENQQLRSAALRIINALDIAGGCNVQFALEPDSHRYYVIEVNPRVSRSSALASKATGYPIARVAAKIAAGKRLEQIVNAITQKTSAAFEPALDYCVVKIPRWPFDKFPQADRRLGTQMKSTGEVMAIGRSFEAAFHKALRSLEQPTFLSETLQEAVLIDTPNDRRIFAIMEALRAGISVEELSQRSKIGRWFIERLNNLINCEQSLSWAEVDEKSLREAKEMGFTDARIAKLSGLEIEETRRRRQAAKIVPTYKSVDTCAAEFEATTPYYYSTFESENETLHGKDSVVVLGSGPIRIGQGIEFDYCSVQAALALRKQDVPAIMINSNPETVSTDFDCSTRLYFEPLDEEAVCAVIDEENAKGVIVQFGGQTAINLAAPLARRGYNILGSSVETIDLAEDRRQFEQIMTQLEIAQPQGAATTDLNEAVDIADRLGYPILVRPSYVLGGRAMEIVHTREALERYLVAAMAALPEDTLGRRGSVLIDKYMLGVEFDVDAICDGDTVLIPGIMEHVERAGVHSGDSMAAYPAPGTTEEIKTQIVDATTKIARAMKVKGLCNVQFVVHNGKVHVIEVNPRASRTVPFLSKVTAVPMVELATQIMLGKKLSQLGWQGGLVPDKPLVAVKAPIFSTLKLTEVDSVLGPEMKSTGEVMGIDRTLGAALEKAFLAVWGQVPSEGGVLCSIADSDKEQALPMMSRLREMGFSLYATEGTAAALSAAEIDSVNVGKIGYGRPNVIDIIEEGRVCLVINTVSHVETDEMSYAHSGDLAPTEERRQVKDGYRIRIAAEQKRIACCTSLDTAKALVDTMWWHRCGGEITLAPIASYRLIAASHE